MAKVERKGIWITALMVVVTFPALAKDLRPMEIYRAQWSDPALVAKIEGNIEQYRKSDASVTLRRADGSPLAGATVEIEQVSHEFLFGSNLFALGQFPTALANRKYERSFLKLFNTTTVPFYWAGTEPERGELRYEEGAREIWRRPPPDRVVDWCLKHGVVPKGHPLVWFAHNPDWLPKDREELQSLFIKRFHEIADRYASTVPIWDVVNEALCCVKDFPLYDEELSYVAWSFREVEPLFPKNTLLYINEVDTLGHRWEGEGGTDSPYYRQVKQLLAEGVPVRAVGFQFHVMSDWAIDGILDGTGYTPERLYNVYELFSGFGLPLAITEVTMPTIDPSEEALAFQAELARNFYRLWFSVPRMAQITWWNLGDGTMVSYESQWKGGLLDMNLDPKPSYRALDELINHEWKTRFEAKTGADGKVAFRGFHGRYRVKVKTFSGQKTYEMDVRPGQANRCELVF